MRLWPGLRSCLRRPAGPEPGPVSGLAPWPSAATRRGCVTRACAACDVLVLRFLPYLVATVTPPDFIAQGRRMGTSRLRTGKVPRHRAAATAPGAGALARHRWQAALIAAGAVALVGGVMFLPGHSAPPIARGCGLVTCAPRRVIPAAAIAESGVRLRGATQDPAPARTVPARPGAAAHATASPPPSEFTPHHGRAKGLARRHCRPPGCH
jgi:hypothetical protein